MRVKVEIFKLTLILVIFFTQFLTVKCPMRLVA